MYIYTHFYINAEQVCRVEKSTADTQQKKEGEEEEEEEQKGNKGKPREGMKSKDTTSEQNTFHVLTWCIANTRGQW